MKLYFSTSVYFIFLIECVCVAFQTALKYGEMQVMILEYSVSVSDKDLVTLKCKYLGVYIILWYTDVILGL